MEVVAGYVAVVIPYIVSICPHGDGWGVTVYGGTEAKDKVDGIVMKHWEQTISESKLWASEEIGRRFQNEFALDPPKLSWENLVCKPPSL